VSAEVATLPAAWLTPLEQEELRVLVYQACELRESPYLRDACEAIVEWAGRRPLARLERAQGWTVSRLVRLLDETDADRIMSRTSA
jgi:hypothetical protein